MGRAGYSQRGLREATAAADGAAAALRRLFYPQEHGGWYQLPSGGSKVSHRRPELPDNQPSALTLHPLLLLYPRPGARAYRAVRRFLLAVLHHLLSQRP